MEHLRASCAEIRADACCLKSTARDMDLNTHTSNTDAILRKRNGNEKHAESSDMLLRLARRQAAGWLQKLRLFSTALLKRQNLDMELQVRPAGST